MKYVKAVSVLIAAFMLGNWFLAEVRKAKAAGKPWFAPYATIPGISIILLLTLLPILARIWMH